MKQSTQATNVTRSNTGGEQEFRIKASSAAFAVLSSGLYTNKILSIVREISCNSWDSHVAAGKQDVPIEIKLPTAVDDTFYCRDVGTGLSHEDVLSIYTTYFESTKTESNLFIGALGLGSKSPFSYTDQFIVESRYKGVKRVYTAFINENGIPSITLMGESDTDDSNGVTVSFSVKPGDRRLFAEAAKTALIYFDPTPIIKGTSDIHVNPITFSVKGTNWNIRSPQNSQYVGGGVRVVQGFVSYPVDMYQLTDSIEDYETKKQLRALSNIDLDVIVPIGEVDVAASRESLSYNPNTKSNLTNRLTELIPAIIAELQIEMDKQPTLWNAAKLYSTYVGGGSSFRDLITSTSILTYRGAAIGEAVSFVLKSTHAAISLERREKRSSRRTSTVENTHQYIPATPAQVVAGIVEDEVKVNVIPNRVRLVVDDIGYGLTNTINEWMGKNNANNVIVFRNSEHYSKKPVDIVAVQDVLAQLGVTLTDVVLTSSITTKTVRKSYYTKKAVDLFKVWQGFTEKHGRWGRSDVKRTFSRLTWSDVSIDMNDPDTIGYYVPVERFTVVREGKVQAVNNFDIILEQAEVVGAIPADSTVIGVSDKEMKKVNTKHWKNLFTVLEDFVTTQSTTSLYEKLAQSRVASDVDYNNSIRPAWKNFGHLVVDCDLKTYLNDLTTKHDIPSDAWNTLLTVFVPDASQNISTVAQSKKTEWNKLVKQHDVLQFMNWDKASRPEHRDAVAKYLNYCVSTLTSP